MAKNRYFPTTVESLRESTKRALDREGTAFKFGELIDKHGRDNWLEPLVDELGPYVQLQLGDMANMLEVFAKLVEACPSFFAYLITATASMLGNLRGKLLVRYASLWYVCSYRSLPIWGFV